MSNFKLLIILFAVLITSCNNKTIKCQDKAKSVCNCFDSNGLKNESKPVLEKIFLNGKRISICGSLHKKESELRVSEFNVFDCSTGKSLTEYDGTQDCRIIEKADTLIIQELKYLPTGKNWAMNSIQVGEQIITTKRKKLIIYPLFPKFESFSIDDLDAKTFLKSLKKGQGFSNEWEIELGKLEALTLLGNKEAESILENYEEFMGEKTDGALAEDWKEALAITRWLKN